MRLTSGLECGSVVRPLRGSCALTGRGVVTSSRSRLMILHEVAVDRVAQPALQRRLASAGVLASARLLAPECAADADGAVVAGMFGHVVLNHALQRAGGQARSSGLVATRAVDRRRTRNGRAATGSSGAALAIACLSGSRRRPWRLISGSGCRLVLVDDVGRGSAYLVLCRPGVRLPEAASQVMRERSGASAVTRVGPAAGPSLTAVAVTFRRPPRLRRSHRPAGRAPPCALPWPPPPTARR